MSSKYFPTSPNFENLYNAVVWEAYKNFVDNGNAEVSIEEFSEKALNGVSLHVAQRFIRQAFSRAETSEASLNLSNAKIVCTLTSKLVNDLLSIQEPAWITQYEEAPLEWLYESPNEPETNDAGSVIHKTQTPASDRFVSVSDNYARFEELSSGIAELRGEFAKLKEARDNSISEDEVMQALSDIVALEGPINTGQVRATLLERAKDGAESLRTSLNNNQGVIAVVAIIVAAILAILL